MCDNSSECSKEERIGIISHGWQGLGWVSGEKVELASLILVISATSVFCLHSPTHMNLTSLTRHSIAPFHRGNGNQRRKCLADMQLKWQELGSALSPTSITIPLPRTRLSSRGRETCRVQVEIFHRHLQEVGSTVWLETYQILKHPFKLQCWNLQNWHRSRLSSC